MTSINKRFSPVTRRRFIAIAAATAGICPTTARKGVAGVQPVEWRGYALGAQAEIKLYHRDRGRAEQLVREVLMEVRRLEGLFSLYDGQSALLTLNRTGILEVPAPEFVALLNLARDYHRLSGGLFDPTVQPLWNLYAAYFSRPDASASGPDEGALAAVMERVGMEHVSFNADRVVLTRPGMALTFNGIAQGFITDQAVALLRRNGVGESLVDFGEIRAMDARPDGEPWQVGIEDPLRPGRTNGSYPLRNMAIATSSGSGFRFGGSENCNHIFDPRTGRCSGLHAGVSIIRPEAAAADAMATAACLMGEAEIRRMLAQAGGGEARIVTHAGEVRALRA